MSIGLLSVVQASQNLMPLDLVTLLCVSLHRLMTKRRKNCYLQFMVLCQPVVLDGALRGTDGGIIIE